MACGVYAGNPIQYFLHWQFTQGVACYYGDSLGITVFMLVFFAGTMFSLYLATDSLMLVVVMAIALGPIVMILLPAIGVEAVVLAAMLALAVGGVWVWTRLA